MVTSSGKSVPESTSLGNLSDKSVQKHNKNPTNSLCGGNCINRKVYTQLICCDERWFHEFLGEEVEEKEDEQKHSVLSDF